MKDITDLQRAGATCLRGGLDGGWQRRDEWGLGMDEMKRPGGVQLRPARDGTGMRPGYDEDGTGEDGVGRGRKGKAGAGIELGCKGGTVEGISEDGAGRSSKGLGAWQDWQMKLVQSGFEDKVGYGGIGEDGCGWAGRRQD